MASGGRLSEPPARWRTSWRAQASCPLLPPHFRNFPPTSPPTSLSGPRCATYWLLWVVHLLHREVLQGYDSPGLLVLQWWRGKGSANAALRPRAGSELEGPPKPTEECTNRPRLCPALVGGREQGMARVWESPGQAASLALPLLLSAAVFPSVKWVQREEPQALLEDCLMGVWEGAGLRRDPLLTVVNSK